MPFIFAETLIKAVRSFSYVYTLQDDLNSLHQWCSEWNVPLNEDKYLVLGSLSLL